jgi:hypothetical protein
VYDPEPEVSYPVPPKSNPHQNEDEPQDNEHNVSQVDDSNNISQAYGKHGES